MIYKSSEMEMQAALQTAAKMCAAIRTAPKTYATDILHSFVLTEQEKDKFADLMEEIGKRYDEPMMQNWYSRDAGNVRSAQAVILVGAEKTYRGVPHCGFCNFDNCANCKAAGGNCGFTYIDLGIALSSAALAAAYDMVDSRIMYSIGKAATEICYVPNCIWLGLPISISGKNKFFDR